MYFQTAVVYEFFCDICICSLQSNYDRHPDISEIFVSIHNTLCYSVTSYYTTEDIDKDGFYIIVPKYKSECLLYSGSIGSSSYIKEVGRNFDCVLIIRGGGSRLDLAWFDNFNIGARISKSKLPVITGIGHDIDSTVADTVAHISLKTPTAVSDYLIEHNLGFETKVSEATNWISELAKRFVRHHELTLLQTTQWLKILPTEIIRKHMNSLDQNTRQIQVASQNSIRKHKELILMADKQISLLDPKNVLKRGYAIIRQEEKIISRAGSLNNKKEIEIQFYDDIVKMNRK